MKKYTMVSTILAILPLTSIADSNATVTTSKSVRDIALSYCQANYTNDGKSYFGQAGEKFNSWDSCLAKKLKDFAIQADPNKSSYTPGQANTEYAKQYCTRTFVSDGKVYYGGAAEAEQASRGNSNAFTSYDSCVQTKIKEHFYGSTVWDKEIPFTRTTPEERAQAYCTNSKEENCVEKQIKAFRKYDEDVAAYKEWQRLYGNDVANNKYEKCAEENSDCGGIMPVRVGKLNIETQLLVKNMELTHACGLRIDYFRAHFYGPNKTKLPDGRILDYGDFDNTIEQDYQYTIYAIDPRDDGPDCNEEGHSWYAESLTRQENIDIAMSLVK